MSTPRTIAAAAVLLLATLVMPTSAARADEPAAPAAGAPVTRADHVTVAADAATEIDVLANDADPDDPSGTKLTVCRVEPPADNPINIQMSTGYDESDFDTGGHPVLFVFPYRARPGTYTVDYYVCDYDYLTPATLTVKVAPSQSPHAEVLTARPGYVRFHNPGKRRAVIQYGSKDGRTVDGTFVLAAHAARTVRTERRAIQWTATIRTRHGASSYGNILRGIKQPTTRSEPASARPPARTLADRTAWRLGTQRIGLRPSPGSTWRASRPAAGRDESTDAPVTAPDTVEVSQGFLALSDVLANDSDPDATGDGLGICRASVPVGSGLEVTPLAGDGPFLVWGVGKQRSRTAADASDPVPYTLLVQAGQKTRTGTYRVTYYACDHHYLTPGTLTVTVTKSQVVTAHKLRNRRGVVRFTNPGPHGATVQVRDLGTAQDAFERMPLIARFKLPAGTSKNLRPRVRSIYWSATSRRGPGGGGIVEGIGGPPRG
ncbi:hypothetical protein [Nocardioides sp.]|uniref:Ig-like domain-containing protein n=1 Tax=Nocardioides sp. TaxID=35761 RepID=UPI0027249684|nr:hypothetical protein [Nocardioides sp.]MDO9455649.1 hypothetical protein [Nocardioides sp.]